MDKQKQLEILMNWVTDQFKKYDPPRFTDVFDYAYRVQGFTKLTRGAISKALRLHPGYAVNARQSRRPLRSGKHRPVLVNNLGHLHADIGFFSVTREYETPVSFRSGYLVAKDILSRFTYVSILYKNKSTDSIKKAFDDIFAQFRKQNEGLKVVSVSFDKEPAVMSKIMQNYFKEKNVMFHAFENTASKSKFAEGAIRLIRETIVRLKLNPDSTEKRWWHLIQPAVDALNSQPIKINGKFITQENGIYFTPRDVNQANLNFFISQVYKAAPSYYFSQFDIAPSFVKFKFNVNDYVKPKLIVTSSAAIGIKRSEVTLEKEVFVIIKRLGFVSRAFTIEPLYICKSLTTNKTEAFEEDNIALTLPPSP
jgi:hypothetical protein